MDFGERVNKNAYAEKEVKQWCRSSRKFYISQQPGGEWHKEGREGRMKEAVS